MDSRLLRSVEITNTLSQFAEEAAWRKENAGWLRWLRQLAVTLPCYMQDNGLKRADLAARIVVSPQYVSKLLSRTENLSFKSVANIENKLGITYLSLCKITIVGGWKKERAESR